MIENFFFFTLCLTVKLLATMENDGRRHVGWCLDGKNYESWKFGMKVALQSDELWGVVEGSELKPDVVSKCFIFVQCGVHVVCISERPCGHAATVSAIQKEGCHIDRM